ncbi:restriction endonuclease subunit S [Umezawaea tangerina]|uniref:restriction endonuclease subunit S n=1 Tax=Umezawaea tangerina TaxID=84725 RepID=UPI0011B270FF|nr:restriction endonuclease subunit S [Umezawaea tangerina]
MRQVLPDEEVLARFVVRTRRIEAHSLLKQEIFAKFPTGSMNMHLSVDGLATIRHPLPPDEEVFESLAARVRPLIVDSEPDLPHHGPRRAAAPAGCFPLR